MARAFLNQELVRKSRRSGFIFVLAARSSLSANGRHANPANGWNSISDTKVSTGALALRLRV